MRNSQLNNPEEKFSSVDPTNPKAFLEAANGIIGRHCVAKEANDEGCNCFSCRSERKDRFDWALGVGPWQESTSNTKSINDKRSKGKGLLRS